MLSNPSQSLRNSAIVLVIIAAASRFIPHPYNFTALGAMSLFAGSVFIDRKISFLLPLVTMLLTDIYFGFHFSILPVYLSLVLTVWIGTLIPASNAGKILLGSLASSLLFFLLTNLPYWYAPLSLYSLDLKGTLESYTMALPFFINQVIGDLFYSSVLFGCYALIRKSAFKKTSINF